MLQLTTFQFLTLPCLLKQLPEPVWFSYQMAAMVSTIVGQKETGQKETRQKETRQKETGQKVLYLGQKVRYALLKTILNPHTSLEIQK